MKKLLYILIISFTALSFTFLSTSFAESTANHIYSSNNDSVKEHITVVEKYKDGIALLSKTALNDACSDSSKIDKHLKDINYLNQQISSRSKAINSQCKIYTATDPLLSDLLTLDVILCEYRLALVHLYQYLTSENIDYQYKSKQSFFSTTTDANRKLSILKEHTK